MRLENFSKDRINYQESCFIVNAMNFYIAQFKENTELSKESRQYYNSIIEKYIKLENDIMNLRIKE
jgi:hypothetical protein